MSYLDDYKERWGIGEKREPAAHTKKKPPAKRTTRRTAPPASHDIRKLMDPDFIEPVPPAPPKPKLEGQIEDHHDCDVDASHDTECFAANSGKLYWRCKVCKQTSGPFAGYAKLIGADGEESRGRKRVAVVSETDPAPASAVLSGKLEFSLDTLARDLILLKNSQAIQSEAISKVLNRLISLENAFQRHTEATNMLVDVMNKRAPL